jgi:hypothetical protein
MEMMKGLDNICYIDCTNTTGAGLIDKLFSNNIQYLLLDEIEKMSEIRMFYSMLLKLAC